ncbi:hypothetical protein [Terriglobus sp. RCC_193]|uniref:hypothetical protein n=1 Tax=Terriglobus sp. RCC_193 TaxID=3239218 RepID=UPI003526ABD8
MADTSASRPQIAPGYTGPRFLGAPVGDFSVLQTILLSLASGAAAFFAATFLAIMSLLVATMFGHKVDFSIAYRWVGVPVGIAVLVIAGVFLTSALVSRIRRSAQTPR